MRKVLVVDDEQLVRETLVFRLLDHGYQCAEAKDGEEALRIFHSDPDIDVGFVDIRMPGKSGLDLIADFRKDPLRMMEVIVMTGYGGVEPAVRALRLGAFDFLQKPFDFDLAITALKKCEGRIGERKEQERIRRDLEETVRIKTEQIQSLLRQVDLARIETVEALAAAAEQRGGVSGLQSRRVAGYSASLAKELGWGEDEADTLGTLALLHDIGKIGVPDAIRLKAGPLSSEEYSVVQAHSKIGYEIITQSGGESMQTAAELALTHHERWDGSGYPQGLAGEEIPEGARIVAICDIYGALCSPQPYREPKSHDEAVRIIVDGDGRTDPAHFDPHVLDVFTGVAADFAEMDEEVENQWRM